MHGNIGASIHVRPLVCPGDPDFDWDVAIVEAGHDFSCGPPRSGKSVFDPDVYLQALVRSVPRRSRRRLVASAQHPETDA